MDYYNEGTILWIEKEDRIILNNWLSPLSPGNITINKTQDIFSTSPSIGYLIPEKYFNFSQNLI